MHCHAVLLSFLQLAFAYGLLFFLVLLHKISCGEGVLVLCCYIVLCCTVLILVAIRIGNKIPVTWEVQVSSAVDAPCRGQTAAVPAEVPEQHHPGEPHRQQPAGRRLRQPDPPGVFS